MGKNGYCIFESQIKNVNSWMKRVMNGLDKVEEDEKVYVEDFFHNGFVKGDTKFLRGEEKQQEEIRVRCKYEISKEVEDMIDKKRGVKL